MVSAVELKKLFPNANPALVAAIVSNWGVAVNAGIVSRGRVSGFLARVGVETGGLRFVEENLNYSARRLTEVWPSRFKSLAAAAPYAGQPKKLANFVYNGRMGNAKRSDDGWTYRGGGMMMTTGREGYRKMGFEKNPEALRDPVTAFKTAVREWKNRHCNELMDAGALKQVNIAINGGMHGYQDFLKYYGKAWRIFEALPSGVARVSDNVHDARPDFEEVETSAEEWDRPAGPIAPPPIVGRQDRTEPEPAKPAGLDLTPAIISKVQQGLRDAGYPEVGNVDGIMGDRTSDAILAFRRGQGMPLTPDVDQDLIVALALAQPRPVSDERAKATAKDLQSSASVRQGQFIKRAGMAVLGMSGLGGLVDGTASIDQVIDGVNKGRALWSAVSAFGPWVLAACVGGVAIFYGGRFVKEQVAAYREGRHV